MLTREFEYDLPRSRIAQEPLSQRDASRLLHLAPGGQLQDLRFTDLPGLLQPGDLLVANESRVRQARLRGRTDQGTDVELLVLERQPDGLYRCLARPGRVLKPGTRVELGNRLEATVVAAAPGHTGARLLRFHADDVDAAIESCGMPPLPPYIHRELEDGERYQTLYAAGAPESAAAPTAGLHFTQDVLERLRQHGVGWATLRLQVGLATFAPMRGEEVSAHLMHEERYELPPGAAGAINSTRAQGGRIVAVGTTAMRVLETCAGADGSLAAGAGSTSLFIRPGHPFRCVDGLLTNFHQPRSSLLVLLAAFTGDAAWRRAYEHALAHGYRFLSFGDCMLCWRAS